MMIPDTPETRAVLHRMMAVQYRFLAQLEDMKATLVTVGSAFTRLAEAFREAERRDIQQHPDLAELDAQLNGFYDTP